MNYQLYNADCFEILKDMPDKSVDHVITDPPYGIKRDVGFGGRASFNGKNGGKIERRQYQGGWDAQRPDKKYFDEILRISKKAFVFGGNFFADILPRGNHWVVWDKLNTMPSFGDCELIWTNVARQSVKKFTYEYNGLMGKEKERFHPTQKPLALMKWLIENYVDIREAIFDPFMGSGTTGVAAIEMGRNFIGCEIDPKYFKIAEKRIIAADEQIKLFNEV